MASQILRVPATAAHGAGLTQNYQKLLQNAALDRFIQRGDLVAIKMHLGEPGNGRYLRPIFPVLLVDRLKELGARPFVTDTPVLYKSLRNNAWDYYLVARRNGFTADTLGCPLIISGGLTDQSVKIKVKSPMRLPEVSVSSEIYHADALISLAHFTLHLQFPFAAAIKNIGMGCVDATTKLAMHEASGTTPRHLAWWEATLDGARVILDKFQGKFFALNLLLDVTPDCDCFDKTDLPVVPDLGILGSTNPAALDKASYDLILAAPGYPGSKLEGSEGMLPGKDKVRPIYPRLVPEAYFPVVARAGLGELDYHFMDL